MLSQCGFFSLGGTHFSCIPDSFLKVHNTVKPLIQFYTGSSICSLPKTPLSSLLSRHLAPFHHSNSPPHHSQLYSSSCPVAARIDAVRRSTENPSALRCFIEDHKVFISQKQHLQGSYSLCLSLGKNCAYCRSDFSAKWYQTLTSLSGIHIN